MLLLNGISVIWILNIIVFVEILVVILEKLRGKDVDVVFLGFLCIVKFGIVFGIV